MSTAFVELISSSPFAIIELFELKLFQDLHGSDEEYYFHAGRNRKTTLPAGSDDILDAYSIKYGGTPYIPLPVEASGFEFNGDGTLPRPSIRFANLQSQITALLLGINQITPGNDLSGARVKRIRTLSRFLDSDNWENGVNPYGNPDSGANAQFPPEIYYIDRKVSENRDFVEFELVSSFDMPNTKAPRRLVMQNLCQWDYKGKECGYSGSDEFTVTGASITPVAASGFGYSTNADKLVAGAQLNENAALVSPNGWFTAKMQKDGNFVIYKKPGGSTDHAIWATNTNIGVNANGYSLVMQADGNLVLYNDDVARNDYAGGSVVWTGIDTNQLGRISSLTRLSVDGADQWYPPDVQQGRSGGFTWELKQSSPGSAGLNTTATKNFTETHSEYGSRSVNITFNLTSIALPADHYSKDNTNYTGFGWNTITGITINSQTGFWKNNEDWIAKVTLTSGNPFRSNHPTEGTLQEAGAGYKVTATGFTNKQLRLKDDGVLVVEDSDGSDVVWSSSNDPITSEPKVVQGTSEPIEVSGTCGKRISDCRLRFPNGDANGGLPFGSFPAVGLNN
nr:putative phage minor tail protein L [uncultured Mediterranean phage uvMED]